MKTFIFTFLFTVLIFQIHAQGNTDSKPTYQYWDNRYIDDKIILRFKSNRYRIKETDSVKVIISVKNISDESIFILKRYGIKHSHSKDSTEQTLHFEFGDSYTGGVELADTLREIKPGKKYISMLYLNIHDFDKLKNGEKFFEMVIGFAYIRSINILLKNEHEGWFKTQRISNNFWTASNMVIWLSLYYGIYLTHYVNFNE